MSRNATNAARAVLIVVAVVLEVAVVYRLIGSPPANLAGLLGSFGGMLALAVHTVACALLAAAFGGLVPGGTSADRASVVLLYFVVAFILPGAGVVGVVWLGYLLGRGGKGTEEEAAYKLGNPLTRPYQDGAREFATRPHLEPLATSMREFDTAEARAAVLALRHRAHRPEVAAVLKRFRNDADSELQFFAGSALDGAVERAETHANTFTQRVAADPEDADAHVGLAEGLIKLARTAAVAGDRRRLAAAACEHLASARERWPDSHRLARLAGEGLMLSGDHESAEKVLSNEAEAAPERLSLLFQQRDWAALRDIASRTVTSSPQLAAALDFCDAAKGGAA